MYYGNGDVYNGEWKNSKKMGKELLFIKAEINMMVIGKKEKRVVKEFIILKMEIFWMEKWKKNGKGVFCCKDKNLEEEGLRWYFEKGRYKVKRRYCIFLELDFLTSLWYIVLKINIFYVFNSSKIKSFLFIIF